MLLCSPGTEPPTQQVQIHGQIPQQQQQQQQQQQLQPQQMQQIHPQQQMHHIQFRQPLPPGVRPGMRFIHPSQLRPGQVIF